MHLQGTVSSKNGVHNSFSSRIHFRFPRNKKIIFLFTITIFYLLLLLGNQSLRKWNQLQCQVALDNLNNDLSVPQKSAGLVDVEQKTPRQVYKFKNTSGIKFFVNKNYSDTSQNEPLIVRKENDRNLPSTRKSSVTFTRRVGSVSGLPLLIDTPSCKLPDFPLYNEETKREKIFRKLKPFKCDGSHKAFSNPGWSSLDDDGNLILNEKEMSESGFRFRTRNQYQGRCCYTAITRPGVEVRRSDWNYNLTECIPITSNVVKVNAEFVLVECNQKDVVTHLAYHANPSLEGDSPRRKEIQEKVNYWKTERAKRKGRLPPNVLIIGHDSTSRLNFRRQMPLTLKFLQNIEAHEMPGYTRVGESTFPNFATLLTGLSTSEYTTACSPSLKDNYQDNCPFVWEGFDNAKYLTAFIEDDPNCAAFHYRKLGFSKQIVDFTLRHLLLKATEDFQNLVKNETREASTFKFIAPCVGTKRNDEFLTEYQSKLIRFAERENVPLFSMLFTTHETHATVNGLQNLDKTYFEFLKGLDLSNTVLFVMSDHGVRYGKLKETLVGNYEENLPNLWVYLGKQIGEVRDPWEEGLIANKNRLLSTFNFHWTLKQLYEYSVVGKLAGRSRFLAKMRNVSSFFEAGQSDRTCKDLGIPDQFCPCGVKSKISVKDKLVANAGRAIVKELHKLTSNPKCQKLRVLHMTGAELKKIGNKDLLVIKFFTMPGSIWAEATLTIEDKGRKVSKILHIQRTTLVNEK